MIVKRNFFPQAAKKPLDPMNPADVPEVGDLVEIPGGERGRVTQVFGRRPVSNGMEAGPRGSHVAAHGDNCIRLRVEGVPHEIKAASVTIVQRAATVQQTATLKKRRHR